MHWPGLIDRTHGLENFSRGFCCTAGSDCRSVRAHKFSLLGLCYTVYSVDRAGSERSFFESGQRNRSGGVLDLY